MLQDVGFYRESSFSFLFALFLLQYAQVTSSIASSPETLKRQLNPAVPKSGSLSQIDLPSIESVTDESAGGRRSDSKRQRAAAEVAVCSNEECEARSTSNRACSVEATKSAGSNAGGDVGGIEEAGGVAESKDSPVSASVKGIEEEDAREEQARMSGGVDPPGGDGSTAPGLTVGEEDADDPGQQPPLR